MGPKTDPCGTPQVKPVGFEVALPVLTVWVLRLKYEANHVRGTPDRPTLSDRPKPIITQASNVILKS